MLKLISVYLITGFCTVILAFASSDVAPTIMAIGSVLGIITGFLSPFVLLWMNKKLDKNNTKIETIGKNIDGLLEQKTLADTALGRLKGIDEAAKEKAIGDDRELQVRKEQDLLHQTPPNSKPESNVSDVKDALETEIRKQGDKVQEIVEKKADEIKTVVPVVTADKVIEKLDPNKDSK